MDDHMLCFSRGFRVIGIKLLLWRPSWKMAISGRKQRLVTLHHFP